MFKINLRKYFIGATRKAEFDKQLLRAQMEVRESNFADLNQELSDNVGQLLITTKMLLGITERGMDNVPDPLMTANETLGKAIHELRFLTKVLTREWLEQFDFNENLRAEIGRITSDGSLQVHYSEAPVLPLRRDEQTILFRIVQETIQSTLLNAHARNLFIFISCSPDELRVVIRDDGVGFCEKDLSSPGGLKNMKHGMRVLGGRINRISLPGSGTQVNIQLPIQPAFLCSQ